jgi:hypothetical protein
MNLQFRNLVNMVPQHAGPAAERKPEHATSDLGYDFGAIFHDEEDREENGEL